MDMQRGIGYKRGLPWDKPIKPDWENLYAVSKGCQMIMGRKSFDDEHRVWSPEGNYVLSSDVHLPMPEGFERVNSFAEALNLAKNEKEIFAIGGQGIFEEALPLATNLHLTFVKETFEADRFFPKFDASLYDIISQKQYQKGNESPFDIEIVHYRRKN